MFVRVKIVRDIDREVSYCKDHWELLKAKRLKALRVLKILKEHNIIGYIYGSVARGDVHKKSDIDIIVPRLIKPYLIEIIIETEFNGVYAREIVQATPKHAVKAHIYIDPETTISFPLTPFTKNEHEFYKFGGLIGLPEAEDYKTRVKGVDKRLVMIIPTEQGHREISILGREEWVAKQLNISIDTVRERVKVLTRRDQIGRTGVYIKRRLYPEESFDIELKKLIDSNPALKRMLRKRKLL
ncbi:MAG: nucleotidyltransferase domain-containing protein [Candidatus Njordarchaeia archaeon]